MSHVYVGAWMLGCFHSHISTQTFWMALTTSVDSCVEIKECPFSGVTNSGRVWRKVPESDAQSVWWVLVVCGCLQTPECDLVGAYGEHVVTGVLCEF